MKYSDRVSLEIPHGDMEKAKNGLFHWCRFWIDVDGVRVAQCPSLDSAKLIAESLAMYLEAQKV